MPKTKFVLRFPPNLVNQPIIYGLVQNCGLKPNILRASISPDEAGHAVLEVEGDRADLEKGRKFLEGCGVHVEPLTQDVRWSEERCTHCTACIAVCPTGALSLDRSTFEVSFDSETCIGCELCIPVCAYRAMEIHV